MSTDRQTLREAMLSRWFNDLISICGRSTGLRGIAPNRRRWPANPDLVEIWISRARTMHARSMGLGWIADGSERQAIEAFEAAAEAAAAVADSLISDASPEERTALAIAALRTEKDANAAWASMVGGAA